MPTLLPVSDLKKYNEVLKKCLPGEPVFLTKNEKKTFVLIDIVEYERDQAELRLLRKLEEANEAREEGWLSLEELKAINPLT